MPESLSSKSKQQRLPLICLVSGRGCNLKALIDATQKPDYPVTIAAVCSDQAQAPALARAGAAKIPVRHFAFDADFAPRLCALLKHTDARILALAGFMRILESEQLAAVRTLIPAGGILNIHPSLLPAFPGLRTHERALAARVATHGCTVHQVAAEVDAGPVVAQSALRVDPHENPEQLAQRVLALEMALYPKVIARLGFALLRDGRRDD